MPNYLKVMIMTIELLNLDKTGGEKRKGKETCIF